MHLAPEAQRVLGALVEKSLATPKQYPLSMNALVAACNQRTGREPVSDYGEGDVRRGLEELKAHGLVKTEYARGSRVPKYAHRLAEQLDLGEPAAAVLALLLLRGPQTVGELRSRSDRLHAFPSLQAVEATLAGLAEHRFGALAEVAPRRPGQKESRWRHLLGTPAPPTAAAAGTGSAADFRAAVEARDWNAVTRLLADDVVFHSPVVYRPYEGREATLAILRALAEVFEEFRYVDVLDVGARAGLVFRARVGQWEVEGWDYLRFDTQGRIAEFTVMLRPLSAVTAVAEGMQHRLA